MILTGSLLFIFFVFFTLNVIYVHLHSCAYLLLEHPVHQPLIGSSCILEPERHHTVTIGSLRCDERSLFLVVWIHTDLVVAGEGVHKTEEFMVGCGVYDEVYPRQRETVLWTFFVDVSEVDTESPLAICFFDEYDVGQPLRILYLPDRSCMEEFANLLIDGFLSFWCKAPPLLLDQFEGWADVQPMSYYCGVNSSHVRLFTCEDVFLLSQKLSEEAFEVFC